MFKTPSLNPTIVKTIVFARLNFRRALNIKEAGIIASALSKHPELFNPLLISGILESFFQALEAVTVQEKGTLRNYSTC
ncbi:MAG: hypothetical protein CL915_12965 [Deltaproteobacteria bacterium]|nr:hypothetical protein [Deltaproteobacteria bacterium]